MKDVDKKNIIFLSDENTPYVKEFTLLSDEEIADLVERRLFSNNYFNYAIDSIHKSKGIIALIRDACGHKLETTLSKIEDGLIPEKCTECRQAEKDKLIAFKDEIQDELKARGLVVVLFETEENTDSLYIECTKCGAKYYLNDDFNLDDEAWEMYCKNWDCMMDALTLENHWLANDIKSGKIVIKENGYNADYSPFVKDYDDWVCDLDEFEGSYEFKCEKCGVVNVLPFGKWECCTCDLELYDICTIEKWDEINDQVTLTCKKCGSKYSISSEDAKDELFECFECYKKQFDEEYICPVCCEKYPKIPNYYDSCELCGFDINRNIKSQTQYTSWLRTTVQPCVRVWNEIDPKYRKALNDLTASLENETKLLTEKAELFSQLSQCHKAINRLTQRISELDSEMKFKDAKISEMRAKTAVLSMLNQSQTSVAKPNFRNLINKFAIVMNDDITMECFKKEMPEEIKANSVLVYGYYDGMAGMSFMVLGLTYYDDGDYTLVWTPKEMGMTIRGECYEKAEIVPVDNKTLFKCFENMISLRDSSSFWQENEIGKTRKFEMLDDFRHFAFPDDILVTFINHDIQKIEKIWARLKKYVGRDKGNDVFVATLLDNPFDERFGIHSGEDIFAVVRQDDNGAYVLFGLKMGL